MLEIAPLLEKREQKSKIQSTTFTDQLKFNEN